MATRNGGPNDGGMVAWWIWQLGADKDKREEKKEPKIDTETAAVSSTTMPKGGPTSPL